MITHWITSEAIAMRIPRILPDNPEMMEKTIITCDDGYRLTGHFFRPATDVPRGAVLIAPATGFRHQVYFSFATWLSEQGFAVLTFSNRGIGD